MRYAVIVGLLGAAAAVAAVWLVPSGAAEVRTSTDNAEALSYLPLGDVLAAQLSTDFESEQFRTLDSRLGRRLLGERIATLAEDVADDGDLVYDREVRPQLGNDIAVAFRASRLLTFLPSYVAALQVKDGAALQRVLDHFRYLKFDGVVSGARLYAEKEGREEEGAYLDKEHADSFVALERDVLLMASDERALRRALARHDKRTGMTPAAFNSRLGDLPRDAPFRLAGEVQPLLSRHQALFPSLRRLLRIPWVKSLRSVSATLGASGRRIRADAMVQSDPARTRPEDLPIMPGTQMPPLVGSLRQFSSGSANQSQATVFLLRAARVAFPRSRFVRDVRRLERAHKISFENEVLRQFDGPSATLMAPNGRFAARSTVRDPRRLAHTMRTIAPDLGRIIEDLQSLESTGLSMLLLFAPDAPVAQSVLGRSKIKVRRLRGQRDFYTAKGLERGPSRVFFGLHRGMFVVGSSERRAKRMATLSAQAPSHIGGTSVLRADLGTMRSALKRYLDIDPGRLGQMLGSLSADRSRLRGSMTIELR
jgi:hypothetical protein